MLFSRKPKPDPQQVVANLRAQALGVSPADAGVQPMPELPNVWAILMETGYPDAVATLFTVTDGTTSLYFSNGGGVIGAGEHESVRDTLPQFFFTAQEHLGSFTPAAATPLPDVGRVRFYIRTFNGILTAEAAEDDLGYGRHELSPVFHAGHAVIGAVREASGG